MKRLFLLLTAAVSTQISLAQDQPIKVLTPTVTSGEVRLQALEKRKSMEEKSFVNNIEFRCVGPTVMSGRVVDVDVDPKDPTHFYVAYASGGLWETRNNGMSFTPIFDNEAVMTIGDIAVDWEGNAIYVGTGENNSSRSSYAGVGIYRTGDNGKSWAYLGLPESHHIGRILIDPNNSNNMVVAVLGHLYSPNKERGIYRSTNGGESWEHVLYVDDNTGAIDVIWGDQSGQVLYASMWHRERRAWNFVESGEGSGIYKSTDGGATWTLLSNEASGFPTGKGVGRIGLAASPDGSKVYALLDNQNRREKTDEEQGDELTKESFRNMSKGKFLKLKNEELGYFLNANGFPEKYTPKRVKELVKADKILPSALTEYLEDANSMLFDTPVIGAEVYVSTDGGKKWTKTHDKYLDDVCYSYGYYFGLIRVNPSNANEIYIAGVPILVSQDGGESFKSINGDNVHVDHHALWINPKKPGHLINGNDGGINISYDNGEHWYKANSPAVGQFYTVAVDMEKPYNVYGGLQDNGVWKGPSTYRSGSRWHQTGKYAYQSLMGGDGMQVAIEESAAAAVYTGFQFGNYYRLENDKQFPITPHHELGERPLRYNWQTPIHLSIHNQDILYMGSNKLHRSLKRGEAMETISDDLTNGGKKGDVSYGTLTSIHESPLKFGLIYTGSDDGLIHVTKDHGNTWERISNILPQEYWVSRVQASSHVEGRVYVALNGYRNDDFTPYLFVSDNYGKSWKKLSRGLPSEPINVVKEDPVNPNLIYVGTDHGVYVTINGGLSWMHMNGGLPAVPVHDLVIHPRDKELVVATHGRSIWIADVQHLQQIDQRMTGQALYVFQPKSVRYSEFWGQSWSKWLEASTPEVTLPFFHGFGKKTGEVTIKLKTRGGLVLNTIKYTPKRGLNYPTYDLSIDPAQKEAYQESLRARGEEYAGIVLEEASNGKIYLQPGGYELEFEMAGQGGTTQLEIK